MCRWAGRLRLWVLAMPDSSLRALNEAELAELRARKLRARYGEDAEATCSAELRSFAPDDPRRRKLEKVRQALLRN
jgi:hypothetical protein